LSKSSNEEDLEAAATKRKNNIDGVHVDIRGIALVKEIDFWLLWFMLGLMTGVGLMTIKYVPSSL